MLKGMLEVRVDFESPMHDHSIKLLKDTNEHHLSYEEDRYDMAAIFDAFEDYLLCTHDHRESLLTCTRHLNSCMKGYNLTLVD